MTTLFQIDTCSPVGGKRTSFTKHGAERSQQRSVPHAVVDYLIDFGESEHDGNGATRVYFSKRAWREFCAYLGTEAKYYERYKSAYAVLSGNSTVITTGWRH